MVAGMLSFFFFPFVFFFFLFTSRQDLEIRVALFGILRCWCFYSPEFWRVRFQFPCMLVTLQIM